MRRFFITLFCLLGAAALSAAPGTDVPRTLYTAAGGRVKTLDPAQADDLASRNMVGAIYDTLLQYHYTARPYRLQPSMLTGMPEANAAMDEYTFTLRQDLYFAADRSLPQDRKRRQITAHDVLYTLLRIADARNHSPVYWMFRGKIRGLNEFHSASERFPHGDFSLYDRGIPGFRILDDFRFTIRLTAPDPRFLYMLAMPNAGIVSRRSEQFYQDAYARNPVGSGPFQLTEWINDYKLTLVRNPDYRPELFPEAEAPSDRRRPLPLLEKVVCYQIKQPMSAWLMFLQGNLDLNTLDKDNLDLVAGGGKELSPALKARNIKLLRTPEFEIRYVGFNFSDPKLGSNLKLRRALSLAYNVQRRVEHSNYQLIPAQGPIPPGVDGFDETFRNPLARHDIGTARELLTEAGYPDGMDPATGNPLELTFDQTGNTPAYRQMGELAANDFAEIGVNVTPVLNNNPRFYEKLRQGKLQLFRLSWVGDYPDAENFLQLFYSKNIGSCNRAGFSDPEYDRMFERILPMPDSPERTRRYREMVQYLTTRAPWIFEGFPISYQLNHGWLQNYHPHDFAFSRWKYLNVDAERREAEKKTFRPLNFSELK